MVSKVIASRMVVIKYIWRKRNILVAEIGLGVLVAGGPVSLCCRGAMSVAR